MLIRYNPTKTFQEEGGFQFAKSVTGKIPQKDMEISWKL